MTRPMVEHLLKTKLSIEQVQILLEDFNKRFDEKLLAMSSTEPGFAADWNSRSRLSLAIVSLKTAVTYMHLAVKDQEV